MKKIAFFVNGQCLREIILLKREYTIGNRYYYQHFLQNFPITTKFIMKIRYNGIYQFCIKTNCTVFWGGLKVKTNEWWDFPDAEEKLWLDISQKCYLILNATDTTKKYTTNLRQNLKTRKMRYSEIQQMIRCHR